MRRGEHLVGRGFILVGIADPALRGRVVSALERAREVLSMGGRAGRRYDVNITRAEPPGDLVARAREIVARGGTLLAAVVEPGLPAAEGRRLPTALRAVHPGLPILGLENDIHGFPPIGTDVDVFEPTSVRAERLVARVGALVATRERPGPVLHLGEGRVLKVAETPYELEAWYRLRYRVYVEEKGLVPPDRLSSEELARRVEIDPLDTRPTTRHVVCMDYGEGVGRCIAGSRVLFGDLSLEALVDLEPWRRRHPGVVPVELSRYIVDGSHRGILQLSLELPRMLAHVSRRHPVKFCSANPATERLYRLMAFRPLGPGWVESDAYRLAGRWLPMMRDSRAFDESCRAGTVHRDFPDCSPELCALLMTTIVGDDDLLPPVRRPVLLSVPLRRRRERGPAAAGPRPVRGRGAADPPAERRQREVP